MQIKVRCRICHTDKILEVDEVMFNRWRNREILIQKAFPTMSIADRELLMSGTCGKCFDEMFGRED